MPSHGVHVRGFAVRVWIKRNQVVVAVICVHVFDKLVKVARHRAPAMAADIHMFWVNASVGHGLMLKAISVVHYSS